MSTPNIVVLYSGTRISPFVKFLLESRKVKFTLIANTLLDYTVSSDPNNKDSAGGYIDMELLSLVSSIIQDDLRQSPLASLFSKSKMISVVPLTPSGQLTATWLSEIRSNPETALEKTHEMFKTLSNYNSYPVEVYPLSFEQKTPITIKYRNQTGSPRVYQNYGFLDFQKRTEIDPDSLDSAITNKKEFSILGYEPKESIIPAEIEKIIKDADHIIISSMDFFSLAVMLSYHDLRKAIKKSQGSVLSISPVGSRFLLDPKELTLIKAFGFNPDINGYFDLLKDIADTICLDSSDSDIVVKAQVAGFNVILEDLFKVDDKNEYLSLILKGAGVDTSAFEFDEPVDIFKKESESELDTSSEEQVDIKKSTESSDVKITSSKEKITKSEVKVKENGKNRVKGKIEQKEESKEPEIAPLDQPEEDEETTKKKSKIEKSINIAKSVVKSTTDAKSAEKDSKNSESIAEKSEKSETTGKNVDEKDESDSEKEIVEEENITEFFNNAIKSIEDDTVEDLTEWIKEIQTYIEKDEGHAIKVANSLINILKQTTKDSIRNNALKSFVELAKENKIQFKNSLMLWIVSHLSDPDFSIQSLQYDIIKRLILQENSSELIGELIQSLIKHLLTSDDMTHVKQERGRVLVLRIAFNTKTLTKFAIRAFLDIFDDKKVSHSNLWPGLSSFSSRMVGIELVEGYTVAKSRLIANEANKKELGSFSKLLDEIVTSWEEGDINHVLSLCGSLSESALRKAKRISLAQNIKKVGTVPLEVLAKSLDQDPKELETLVYEMVMNDDISAKLEIVDGRLYIMPIDETKEDEDSSPKTEATSEEEKEIKGETENDSEPIDESKNSEESEKELEK